MRAFRFLALALCLFCSTFVYSQTIQQCQAELDEVSQITELARQQIDDLQQVRANKTEIIEKHKLKISLLEKRIALLQSGDEKSDEMIALLEENQDLCLAMENQAYQLMQKIMLDYKEAVDKATRPWFLDPSFYGGILIGALIAIAF